jgi:heme a synthase
VSEHFVSPRAFLRIAQINLVVVALNIVTGAAVRLTDSGLGCPDWPTCSRDRLTPPLALHPLVEFSNRMVVVALTCLTVVAVVGALRRAPPRRDLTWLAGGLAAGVVAEAVIGAVVVYTKLNPFAVMIHFLVGIAVLTDATVLCLRAGRGPGPGVLRVERRVVLLTRAMVGLLLVVIVLGTGTTGTGPHAGAKTAARLRVPLTDMTRAHSGTVIVLVALTLLTLWTVARTSAPAVVADRGHLLMVALVAQGVVGYSQYFTHLPPLLVGIHVAGATTVWVTMLWFADGLWRHQAERVPAPDATEYDRRVPATDVRRATNRPGIPSGR